MGVENGDSLTAHVSSAGTQFWRKRRGSFLQRKLGAPAPFCEGRRLESPPEKKRDVLNVRADDGSA